MNTCFIKFQRIWCSHISMRFCIFISFLRVFHQGTRTQGHQSELGITQLLVMNYKSFFAQQISAYKFHSAIMIELFIVINQDAQKFCDLHQLFHGLSICSLVKFKCSFANNCCMKFFSFLTVHLSFFSSLNDYIICIWRIHLQHPFNSDLFLWRQMMHYCLEIVYRNV